MCDEFANSSFLMLTIINSYNLIDGIDGLASIVGIVIMVIYTTIFYLSKEYFFALIAITMNACLMAFFGFNISSSKKIFMGDTGSLSMGGALGIVSVITKHELVLAIVGGLFVVEALSVIIQVLYFKRTGKRVFLMAPIHHHFEKLGWTESQVVIRFWIIAVILALIGLSSLKLR